MTPPNILTPFIQLNPFLPIAPHSSSLSRVVKKLTKESIEIYKYTQNTPKY